jgi:phosphatidylglycerophosphate synthase
MAGLPPGDPDGALARRVGGSTSAGSRVAAIDAAQDGCGPARKAVVGEVADRFEEARRVLNLLAGRHLSGHRECWFPGLVLQRDFVISLVRVWLAQQNGHR